MPKLNKMELHALAGSILRQLKEAKLPKLVQEWEHKKQEAESSELYKELQIWLKKHSLQEKHVINNHQLSLVLGLSAKPTQVTQGLPTLQNIVDKLVIGQITDTDITSLVESVKQELLISN
jgi:hypothetical protein